MTLKSSSPKIIPLCPAFFTLAAGPEAAKEPTQRGRILETVVGTDLLRIPGANVSYWREGADEIDFVVEQGKHVYGVEIKSGQKTFARGSAPFLKQHPNARVAVVTWENYTRFAVHPFQFLEQTAISA